MDASLSIILYNFLGIIMFVWYAMIRWTLFADQAKYPWAYAPINMLTAFLSIPFIIISLFTYSESLTKWMYWLAIFLIARNIYYTVEDIADYIKKPSKMQLAFILLDVAMVMYTAIWIWRYRQ